MMMNVDKSETLKSFIVLIKALPFLFTLKKCRAINSEYFRKPLRHRLYAKVQMTIESRM